MCLARIMQTKSSQGSNVPIAFQFLLWTLVGGITATVNLWMLHRCIERTCNIEPRQAAWRITSRSLLRLLAMLPLLFLAAKGGPAASIGFLVGYLLGRTIVICYRERQFRPEKDKTSGN